MKSSKKGLLLVILSGLVYGLMPLAVTFCYARGANKFLVLFFRYLMLTAVLLPIIGTKKSTWAFYRKHWLKLLLLSLTGVSTPLLLYIAYDFLPTGVVTTIHFLYPTVVALVCVVIFREKPSPLKLLCLILCVTGMLLMLNTSGQEMSVPGILIAVASALTWAAYIVMLDKFDFGEASSTGIMFGVSLNGTVLGLIACAATQSLIVPMAFSGWLLLIGVGAAIAVGGMLFFSIGVRETDAQVSSITSTLEPITSLVAGAVFLHEGITFLSALGAALILSAVVLLSVFNEKA